MKVTHIVFLDVENLLNEKTHYIFACGGKNGTTNSNLLNLLRFIEQANDKLKAGLTHKMRQMDISDYKNECDKLGIDPITSE